MQQQKCVLMILAFCYLRLGQFSCVGVLSIRNGRTFFLFGVGAVAFIFVLFELNVHQSSVLVPVLMTQVHTTVE